MLCRLPIETNRNRENSFIYIYTETFSIVLMKPCFLPFALGVSCWVFGDVVFVAKTSSHLRFNKNSLKKTKKTLDASHQHIQLPGTPNNQFFMVVSIG